MSESRVLTAQQLRDAHACRKQIDLFVSFYGESVEVTPELCESVAGKFDWDWATAHLLTTPAQAEYGHVAAPAWVEYERATAQTWARCYIEDRAPAGSQVARAHLFYGAYGLPTKGASDADSIL